jgi:hypothetical protein
MAAAVVVVVVVVEVFGGLEVGSRTDDDEEVECRIRMEKELCGSDGRIGAFGCTVSNCQLLGLSGGWAAKG